MRISLCINTAASDPLVNTNSNWYRKAGYGARYGILKEKMLPVALQQGFDEVIVAGVFEEGDGYQYVPVPPRYRDRRDALWQREMGARYATGDILVFSHDDHSLEDNFRYNLAAVWGRTTHTWDLIIPRRIHGITGAELNNGKETGYMGGHALVMKRWLWAQVSWTSVDSEWWDTSMTRLWKEAGGKLVWAEDLVHIDVEATEEEN